MPSRQFVYSWDPQLSVVLISFRIGKTWSCLLWFIWATRSSRGKSLALIHCIYTWVLEERELNIFCLKYTVEKLNGPGARSANHLENLSEVCLSVCISSNAETWCNNPRFSSFLERVSPATAWNVHLALTRFLAVTRLESHTDKAY